MLTITTEKQIIYINIDLLKSKLKRAILTLLRLSTFICGFSGAVWILGTAGSSDNNAISFYQILKQLIQGGFFCGIAYILNFVKNALQ